MLNQLTINADLCVVGGGLAGICTAIAAARHNTKVVLIHERPVLGGNASSEIRMWVCGAKGKYNRETGIIEEIMLENLYRNPTKNYYIWDSVLLDFVKREKNITLLLNTTCIDAETEDGSFPYGRTKKILSVKAYRMTTQQFIKVNAKYFADCSGDSILAPLSCAEFMYGRESCDEYNEDTHVKAHDTKVMGMSCLIQGIQTENSVKFTPSEFVTKLSDNDVANRPMDIYSSTENFWYLELGGNRDTIAETEEIKDELIPLALGAWDYIKNSGHYDADRWDLEFLGFLPGKRESRRMKGEYVITQRDLSDNIIFDDTVAYGGWPLDDHEPDGYFHKGAPNSSINTPSPYCLPYRALYSENVDNLYFAGRNISMTHTAMSSIRVMATCGLLGQAVGTAVSVATKYGISPHGVYSEHIGELQRLLMNDDCFLPHFKREISDVCRNAILIGGNNSLRSGEDRANVVYQTEATGCELENGSTVEYVFSSPESVRSVHIVFDSDLNRDTLPGDWCERTRNSRANVLLTSPQMCLPKTLCKSFKLYAVTENGEKELLSIENNVKRCYHVELGEKLSGLRLQIFSNWGESIKTKLISFDFT